MLQNYGCQNMVNPIRRILIKHVNESYQDQKLLEKTFASLNYFDVPNFSKAVSQYQKFISLLNKFHIELHFLPKSDKVTPDSIYTHDPCIVSNKGIILCSMGKDQRVSEVKEVKSYFKSLDIPILGQIMRPGKLEGGDVVWINEKTVAIGEGYRSNAEGIRQFKKFLGDDIENIITVTLPHWNGPSDCLHLMSNLSPIDKDLYLIYPRLLPVPFLKYLSDISIDFITVPEVEYETMGCNVLAIEPRKVIMLDGNPMTKKRLENHNVEVHCYDGSEISLKGSGGPTCLTRPFYREFK